MHLLKKNVDVKLSASEVAMAPCPFFISSWKLFVLICFLSLHGMKAITVWDACRNKSNTMKSHQVTSG